MNCGLCLFVLSLIGIILMIYALAIQINDFNSEWGEVGCGDDITSGVDYYVKEKIAAAQIWEYLSAMILMASIVGLCSGLYLWQSNRAYKLDSDGQSKKDIEGWNVSRTRSCWWCHMIVWIIIFTLIVVWFWMMVSIVAGLDTISGAKNCTKETSLQEAVSEKLLEYGFLITLSLIGGIICGIPLICAICCGKSDDEGDEE